MSARDVIMHVAFRETYEGKARDLRDAMDAFAHELAEEIREFAAKRTRIDSEDETYGMNMGADLIDPKVKK